MNMEATEDPYVRERVLQRARDFVLVSTAGLALVRTEDVVHLVALFRESTYVPCTSRHPRGSGRKSAYRELRDKDLVDHAFWMARHFYPTDMESVRLYVMISVKVFFLTMKPDVYPKALEPLRTPTDASQPPVEDHHDLSTGVVAGDFSDDDDDDSVNNSGDETTPNMAAAAAAVANASQRFALGPQAAWVQIHRPSGKTQHKKERSEPSLTMRHPGFYDLDTRPLNWPRAVHPAYLYDNDAMALLVLSPTAHGALRFRPGQESASLDAVGPSARFVYERAAWPVFVSQGAGAELFMPTDAVVIEAEKVRLLHHTHGGLNTKEVNAYWPPGAKSLQDFNAAQRPDGSRLWLVSAQSLCRNARLAQQQRLKLPKGSSSSSSNSPDAAAAAPAWYMPVTDRLKVLQAHVIWTTPSVVYDLARLREAANSAIIKKEYAKNSQVEELP